MHIISPSHGCMSVCIVPWSVLHRAAEEEAAKAAAAEAKKAREAEKKVIKKQRQLLRGIAEGQGQQRLMSEGRRLGTAVGMPHKECVPCWQWLQAEQHHVGCPAAMAAVGQGCPIEACVPVAGATTVIHITAGVLAPRDSGQGTATLTLLTLSCRISCCWIGCRRGQAACWLVD